MSSFWSKHMGPGFPLSAPGFVSTQRARCVLPYERFLPPALGATPDTSNVFVQKTRHSAVDSYLDGDGLRFEHGSNHQPFVLDIGDNGLSILDTAAENALGQRCLQLALHSTTQRASAVHWVVADLG